AIRQDAFLRRARRERDPGAGLRRGGFKMRAQHTGTPKGGTACSSTQDNFGVGVGSRTGISGCQDFSGSNGSTNASTKSKTFLKSSIESSSACPKIPATTRLKHMWPMSSHDGLPHYG